MAANRFVPVTADATLTEQRIVEAYVHVPPAGALTGWAALRVHQGRFFDGRRGPHALPVPIIVGDRAGRRSHEGIRLSYEPLPPAEVVVRREMRVAVPMRALFDEMRRPGTGREAVVAFDMAAAAFLVTPAQMRSYVEQRSRWHRARLARAAIEQGRPASRSPMETRLRLIWVIDAGLPPPHVNREVFDLDGRLVCIPDLFDEEAGLVVEFDGAEHRGIGRHTEDVRREESCRAVGLEYCKVTGLDMRDRTLVVHRLLAARGRALFLPAGQRGWTLDYPPGHLPWIRLPTNPRF